jgi:eukaryotic-like serine/threonine-protein kinase
MLAKSNSAEYLPMDDVMSGWLNPTPTKPDPKRHECLGRYQIQSVLGRGGMATVYLASSGAYAGSRRWCALKLLRDELAQDETYLKMFLSEARIGSELVHPNVCSVFDYGCIDGRAYLAMELLCGKSLAAVKRAQKEITDPAIHSARIARIIADACEGLEAIHVHRAADGPIRVVHRDISPDNLVLTFDGFVKIIDFGLAKADHGSERTRSGVLKGKVSYIAPELLRGKAPDARTDLWSLGVVAWELLTGRRLFPRATDAETLKAVMDAEIPPPSQARYGLPPELDAVVLGALVRDPDQRYASAAEFNDRLWEFLVSRGRPQQHRDIARWLDELFPGERERTAYSLETTPDDAPEHPSPYAEPAPKVASHRPRRRISLDSLRFKVWPPNPRTAVVAVLLGVALFSASAWTARRLKPMLRGPTQAAALQPGVSLPVIGVAQTTMPTSGGFVVEIERPELSNDVVVRVRATPKTSAPPLMHKR